MLIKYIYFIYLLSQVNCYLIIINKKNVIIKETYNGKFVENYKYNNKKSKLKDYNLSKYKLKDYNLSKHKLKDYNLYLDK